MIHGVAACVFALWQLYAVSLLSTIWLGSEAISPSLGMRPPILVLLVTFCTTASLVLCSFLCMDGMVRNDASQSQLWSCFSQPLPKISERAQYGRVVLDYCTLQKYLGFFTAG